MHTSCLHTQVSIQVVSDIQPAHKQELLLTLTAVRSSTSHGEVVKETGLSDDSYSSWFPVTRSSQGTVESVFYPEGEESQVLALKKTVVGLLSFTLGPSAAAGSDSYTSEEIAVHGSLTFSNALHGRRLERHATTHTRTHT